MSVTRAAVVRVEFHRTNKYWNNSYAAYHAYYRVLKRGRKPLRWMLVLAQDEMAAFLKAQTILRQRGYKV